MKDSRFLCVLRKINLSLRPRCPEEDDSLCFSPFCLKNVIFVSEYCAKMLAGGKTAIKQYHLAGSAVILNMVAGLQCEVRPARLGHSLAGLI